MKKVEAVLALVMAVLSLGQALAQGELAVDSQAAENHFPKDITFRLTAHAERDITRVTLYYRIGNSSSLAYAYPAFVPGRSIEAEHVLSTGNARGSGMAPGSEIEYFYEIADSAGARLKTEPVRIVYEDTRFTWQELERPGIAVYYYGPVQPAQTVLAAAWETLARMKASAGVSLERPAKIYLYRTAQDMNLALPFMSETTSREVTWGGMAFPNVDEVIMRGSGSYLELITAHELTHLLTHQLTDNPFSHIPAWLNEGLSMYAGGQFPSNQQAVSDAIHKNTLLSLRAISSLPGKPEEIDLFYGEAFSVVSYLIDTYGPDQMSRLLATFKEGNNTNDALMKAYGFDIDGLEAKWRASIGAPVPVAASGQVGPSQPQFIPTFAPIGSGQPQTAPVASAQTKGQAGTGAVPYGALAGGALVLSVLVLAFRRSKVHSTK